MMQKTPIFTTFSTHTKMAADKRGQIEVSARTFTTYLYTCTIDNIDIYWLLLYIIVMIGFLPPHASGW